MFLEYPGRIAAIEMHCNYGDTLYNDEANQRWSFYPGTKYFPELYIDGHRHTGIWYWLWEDTIVSRMNQPSPVAITMSGTYNSYRGTGTVTARYRNDSSSAIRGKVMFVVVEDSIYHVDVSGKNWHNHVAKDYIPGPNGQMITIPAGDSVIYTQPFTIPASWRYDYCSIVTFLQDTVAQPDGETKYVWQSGTRKITQMIEVEEAFGRSLPPDFNVTAGPNPFTRDVWIIVNHSVSGEYTLDIFNSAGRLVKNFKGEMIANQRTSVYWNGTDDSQVRVAPGVYFYSFRGPGLEKSGKIIAL